MRSNGNQVFWFIVSVDGKNIIGKKTGGIYIIYIIDTNWNRIVAAVLYTKCQLESMQNQDPYILTFDINSVYFIEILAQIKIFLSHYTKYVFASAKISIIRKEKIQQVCYLCLTIELSLRGWTAL